MEKCCTRPTCPYRAFGHLLNVHRICLRGESCICTRIHVPPRLHRASCQSHVQDICSILRCCMLTTNSQSSCVTSSIYNSSSSLILLSRNMLLRLFSSDARTRRQRPPRRRYLTQPIDAIRQKQKLSEKCSFFGLVILNPYTTNN
jgi:hypothetical protein